MNATKTKQYTHLFFDLDNTLTRANTRITKKMQTLLESLRQDVVVVSGATVEQTKEQLGTFECFVLGQMGNHATFGEEELWYEALKPDKTIEIMDHVTSIPIDWEVFDKNDLLHDMGCQIAFSLYGFSAPLEEKEAFDPDGNKRKKILEKYPLLSNGVEATISGTTRLDYIRKGKHKGYNIARLIERLGWNKDECVYFGDSLYEQGNDYSVVGVIDTISVKNPEDTYRKIKAL
jgi:HAD superfamily hydrolase (TIGR01484 family)